MNECLGQSSCYNNTSILISINMVKSNGAEYVGFTKRTKGIYKGDIYK